MLLIKLYFSVFDSILAQFYYKNTETGEFLL